MWSWSMDWAAFDHRHFEKWGYNFVAITPLAKNAPPLPDSHCALHTCIDPYKQEFFNGENECVSAGYLYNIRYWYLLTPNSFGKVRGYNCLYPTIGKVFRVFFTDIHIVVSNTFWQGSVQIIIVRSRRIITADCGIATALRTPRTTWCMQAAALPLGYSGAVPTTHIRWPKQNGGTKFSSLAPLANAN